MGRQRILRPIFTLEALAKQHLDGCFVQEPGFTAIEKAGYKGQKVKGLLHTPESQKNKD